MRVSKWRSENHRQSQSYQGETKDKLSRNKKGQSLLSGPLRWIPESGVRGVRNLGNFCLGNLESLTLEFGIQLKASGIPLTGIQNLESTTWSPESKTISWIPLHRVNYHYILFNTDFASGSWIPFQSILFNAILGLLSFSSLFDTYKEFNLETGNDTQNSCEAHLQKHQQQQTT